MKKAEDILAYRDREQTAQANFRNLWQETADLMFPRQNQITDIQTPGGDKTQLVFDRTAVRDSQDMASGLSAALIPTGQAFFGLKVRNKELERSDSIMDYLHRTTEILHEEMFESNFMLQLNETLRSLVVFGTGNLFSEWDANRGKLNYKDYDISSYQIIEDAGGNVDTVILTFHISPRHAVVKWGEQKLHEKIIQAAADPRTRNKPFEFIQYVGPRKARNQNLKDSSNMPWESVYVDVTNKAVVDEGGFEEMPFSVARWMKSSAEKWGRGQGTECLSDVKVLQRIWKDLIDCANKHVNPPLEVLESFDGEVRATPGAIHHVQAMGSIQAVDQRASGNFPIGREILEFQRDTIHDAFFRDIFVQLADLRGDRRTTVEIMERVREGLRRLSQPVARLQSELLNPVIVRSLKLLLRNGRLPEMPPELAGEAFGIEYEGQLALALRDQQAKGFMQLAAFVGQMEEVFPGASDNISSDRAIRRMARSFGVNADDMATEEEMAAIREERQKAQQAAQAAEMAQTAGKAYGSMTQAPDAGSPAEALMGAAAEGGE